MLKKSIARTEQRRAAAQSYEDGSGIHGRDDVLSLAAGRKVGPKLASAARSTSDRFPI